MGTAGGNDPTPRGFETGPGNAYATDLRDKKHGRVYRLVHKDKPLLKPVTQAGKPIAELLEQLKSYELRTRYRARREIRDRNKDEVYSAVAKWIEDVSVRWLPKPLAPIAAWGGAKGFAVGMRRLDRMLSRRS